MLGRVQVLPRSAPAGAFGDLDPALRAAGEGRYRRRPVLCRIEGKPGRDRAEIVRDVLGADRLLGEPAFEAARRAASPCVCRSRAAARHRESSLRASMRELGEIRQGGRAEIEQVLPLQIAPRPLPGDRGDPLGAMLGQGSSRHRLKFPLVLGTEATRDDAHARR